MSNNKRKASGVQTAPMSVSAGLVSSEQAGQPGGAPSTSKRTKGDTETATEEDLTGDLDLQEQERKRLQQGRKGRVVTAGYDSDEDSEESGGEEDEEGGNGKVAGVDEDDDMFNLEEEGKEEERGKGKKKQFLELGDIEGQEFEANDTEEEERDAELELETDDGEEEVDSEEKEALHDPDDVVQPLKRKKRRSKGGEKEDMGFQMDSFHMKNEMASGRFDEDGNYIANAKDPHAEHDKWLTGNYSRKGIKEAREAKEKREKVALAKEKKQDNAKLDEEECMKSLAELMRKGESVLEALQRLGAAMKKKPETKQGKDDGMEGANSKQEKVRKELDQLTSLTSTLMSKFGRLNVYDETYESLVRIVRRSGLVRETWDPAADEKGGKEKWGEGQPDGRLFTYRWSPSYLAATSTSPEPDVQTFGPYPASELKTWYGSGYFGEAGERILLQPSDANQEAGRGWKRWEQVFDQSQ